MRPTRGGSITGAGVEVCRSLSASAPIDGAANSVVGGLADPFVTSPAAGPLGSTSRPWQSCAFSASRFAPTASFDGEAGGAGELSVLASEGVSGVADREGAGVSGEEIRRNRILKRHGGLSGRVNECFNFRSGLLRNR